MNPPGWKVREGILECGGDGTLLQVRDEPGQRVALYCWRCRSRYPLTVAERFRLRPVLDQQRKLAGNRHWGTI